MSFYQELLLSSRSEFQIVKDMKPLIFVTNDDGISAKGIRSLIEVAMEFGEVLV